MVWIEYLKNVDLYAWKVVLLLVFLVLRWNTFRSLCNFERRVGVALEVSADLPSQEKINRWLGEPIHCLILSTSLFLTNKKGYPVLSKAHQSLIRQFMPLNVQIVISGVLRHASIHHYQSYMDYLWQVRCQCALQYLCVKSSPTIFSCYHI